MNDFQKARIEILPGARQYFKSLKKNQSLLNRFKLVMNELQKNPYLGY